VIFAASISGKRERRDGDAPSCVLAGGVKGAIITTGESFACVIDPSSEARDECGELGHLLLHGHWDLGIVLEIFEFFRPRLGLWVHRVSGKSGNEAAFDLGSCILLGHARVTWSGSDEET